MNELKDQYFVAVKVLMRRGEELLITHDVFGDWDIPGGRIKPDEFDTPLEDIISRKIREELGDKVKYSLGKPRVFFRHKRLEHNSKQPVRIFAIGYEAKYEGGEIKLGDNHDKHEWVDAKDFSPEDYFDGGWLKGLQEYQGILRNEA
ncbi:NUDIX domain-containing protein [Candidatus Saccharibacteria bacterium]|nr:NUDIX domain-containing protein [Candidatus Saccharibacteria bacterium]